MPVTWFAPEGGYAPNQRGLEASRCSRLRPGLRHSPVSRVMFAVAVFHDLEVQALPLAPPRGRQERATHATTGGEDPQFSGPPPVVGQGLHVQPCQHGGLPPSLRLSASLYADRLESNSTGSSFPAIGPKSVPLAASSPSCNQGQWESR